MKKLILLTVVSILIGFNVQGQETFKFPEKVQLNG